MSDAATPAVQPITTITELVEAVTLLYDRSWRSHNEHTRADLTAKKEWLVGAIAAVDANPQEGADPTAAATMRKSLARVEAALANTDHALWSPATRNMAMQRWFERLDDVSEALGRDIIRLAMRHDEESRIAAEAGLVTHLMDLIVLAVEATRPFGVSLGQALADRIAAAISMIESNPVPGAGDAFSP